MKNLKKLGKVLSTKEQKNVNGGHLLLECPFGTKKTSCGCCKSEAYCQFIFTNNGTIGYNHCGASTGL